MQKLLKRMKLYAWIILALGLGASIAIILCFYKLQNDDMYYVYLIISTCLLAFICVVNFIGSYLNSYAIEKHRHLTELKATDIVGNDIGAAYDFGQIGLIVVDNSGTVLWLNNFLMDRGINVVDYPIGDFSKELDDLFKKSKSKTEDTTTCVFSYNSKYYRAKYISEAELFILKDITDYETLSIYNDNHALVVGYLNLDNYSDMPSSDELEKAEIDGEIRKKIFDYFRKFNCLVKPIKIDSYFLLMAKEDLDKMVSDNFSIVPTFAHDYDNKGLTASLGFGYGSPDYNRNHDLASSSLDVALSRGGNQCVVARFGENMMFYGGGNSESKSKTNKVRINSFARSFTNLSDQGYSNVLIIPHNYADMDAIGACLGVYYIWQSLKKKQPVNIVYSRGNIEAATDAACRSTLPREFFNSKSGVFVDLERAKSLKKAKTLIVLIDHNSIKQSIFPELIDERYDHIAVIDHHRKQDNSVESPVYEYIDSASSSTCELLSLYIDSYSFKVNLTKEAATIMLSGIYLDTANFKQKTRILTHEAAIVLTRLGADETKARDFLKESYESFVIKSKIVANIETTSYGILIAKADDNVTVDSTMLANVCAELKEVGSTRACFAIGRVGTNAIYISSRGNGQVNCELLMMKLGGGGHFSAAATKINDITVDEAEARLKHVLDQYLKDATNISAVDEDEINN